MFKKVLVPVDVAVAQGTRPLLAAAKELSQNWDCELHVATVIPDFGMAIVGSYFEEGFEEKNRAAAAEQLEQVMAEVGIKATGRSGYHS